MADYNDQIEELEEELRNTKYNKRTQHAVGLLKAKIARLREKKEKKASGGKKGEGYAVKRSGDATVILLGFPSVGKSTLLNKLTNAESEVGNYEFTTLDVIPGTLDYKHAKIQLLDVPGIVGGASDGTGRGKEVLSVMRNADMAVILLDINHPERLPVVMKEVYNNHIRINQHRPDIRVRKTAKNGIRIGRTVKTSISDETIRAILREFRINNAEVLLREDINEDQLIDVLEANKVYMPAVVALNKADSVAAEKAEQVKKQTQADILISAEKGAGLDELKEMIFSRLGLIRIFLKQPGKDADMEEPLIIGKDSTIRDVCEKLHKDFVDKFRFVRIWGPSSKFPGQKLLGLNHQIRDRDVLELHIR